MLVFISAEQVDNAQKISYETGMRLGRVLILNNFISHSLLTQALDLQGYGAPRSHVSAAGCGNVGGQCTQSTLSLPISHFEIRGSRIKSKRQPKSKFVLANFLVMSGLASENEILNAMETSLSKQLSLGEAIVALGLISQNHCLRKLKGLHEQVSQGEVTSEASH
jgi:hypothetical protein